MKAEIINKYGIESAETYAAIELITLIKDNIDNEQLGEVLRSELSKQYKDLYKAICNQMREELNSDNLLEFGLSKEDKKTVVIYEFDAKAGEDDFYSVGDTDERLTKELTLQE